MLPGVRATPRPLAGRMAPWCAAFSALLLCACSSGDPTSPPGQVAGTDTYLLARVTVLDQGFPCVPGDCVQEFFDCRDLSRRFAGDTYDVFADQVAAGFVSDQNFTIAGSDFGTEVGLTLEIGLEKVGNAFTGNAVVAGSGAVNGTFIDLFLRCDRINLRGQPESHFEVVVAESSVTLTTVPLTADRSAVAPAVPVGSTGVFSPAGIVEGTFTIVGTGVQNAVNAKVRADGCFRVNLPANQQGVPTTPTPASPGPGCP